MWRGQVRALEAAGHEAIALDLPGHGARFSERFTLEGAVDAIAQAVADARYPVVVCGFSLGGYTAIHYAGAGNRPIVALIAASCGTTRSASSVESSFTRSSPAREPQCVHG